MEAYEALEIKVVVFDQEDVITDSCVPQHCPDFTGPN